MAKKSTSTSEITEAEILERIAAAGIRLRFDRVALRVLDAVKAGVAEALPVGQSIAFSVTAPIKLPAKTIAALQDWLGRLDTHESSTTINGNKIRARCIYSTATDMPRVIGFVHSPGSDAAQALHIAESTLLESSSARLNRLHPV